MHSLKVGIIGLGFGERHVEGYKRSPGCEVAVVCDFSEEKRSYIKEKYPDLNVVDDADKVILNPDIDIVSIASHDNYHYGQVVAALSNRKHVFVEKPLCLHEKEMRHIKSLLRENPRLHLASNLILRMYPRFRAVKNMIQKGEMGDVYYLEGDYNYGRLHKIVEGWRSGVDDYSVVLGGGVHIVDLLMWFAADRVDEVSAYANKIVTKNTKFRYNDMVVAIMKFKNGAVGKVTANFGCVYPHFHNLAVYGSAMTFMNTLENGVLFNEREKSADNAMPEPYPGVHKTEVIESFVRSIIEGTPSEVTEQDVFDTMSVCFAIDKSAASGRPARVDYI